MARSAASSPHWATGCSSEPARTPGRGRVEWRVARNTTRICPSLAGIALACACVQDVAPPTLDSLQPAWGWTGESTDVVLLGDDFYPGVSATGADRFEIDRQFDAWLELDGEQIALEGVSLQDLGSLGARVPAGVEPGRYDVGLRTPNGGEALLQGGFSVTETRADHLELDTESLTHPVLSLARVGVQLVDPAARTVPEALPIRVTVLGADDPASLRFEQTLDDQRWDGTLPGIRGTLGAGGTGFVALTSETPGDLWLEITADDEGSVVAGASQFLAFTAGGVATIEVSLPAEDFVPEAGTQFPLRLTLRDELGNPTDGAVASVTLLERCGDADTRFRRTVVFADEHVLLDAYLAGSTGSSGCAGNGFEVVGQADGAPIQGVSRDVLVTPGPPSALTVEAFPDLIQAGVDPIVVVVSAEDAFGNPTPEATGSVTLSDTAGGLGPETGPSSCRVLDEGVATCEAWPVRAGDAVDIVAITSGGLSGSSDPIEVLAGAPDHLEITTSPPTVAAGDLFDLTLRADDAWDNPVGIDPTGGDVPEFGDGEGSVSCAWTASEGGVGEERFACAATHAEPAKVVVATLAGGASGQSAPFEVTNGDLAKASLDLAGVSTITAGDPIDLAVQALDAWDNAYVVQSVASVDIYDKSGEVVAEPLALDAFGAGSLRLRPTVSWTANQLDAYDGAALLGRSSAFDVTAGSVVGLGVELPRTWVEVDEDVDVTVTAEDAYGNPVPGFAGTVALSSDQGAAPSVATSSFTAGTAVATMRWEQVALQDRVEADGAGLAGTSGTVDAAQDCGTSGPSASLEIGGDVDHVTCRVGGVTPSTSLDASGSGAGASALLATHLSPTPTTWVRTVAGSTTATWDTVGATEVRAVVVDTAGCMDESSAWVWVGDSDGEPTGPVTVTPSSGALVAGSTTLGSATVELQASDCAGDPASGGTLAVRADLGALSSGTSTLSASGAGLELALDAAGEGQITWSMTTTAHDGTATLHAGTPAGSAHGDASVDVSGEFAPPTVLSVDPVGTRGGTFQTVSLTFSESMLGSSLTSSTVSLTAPDGTIVTDATLDVDDDTVTITLDDEEDAGSGTWSLGVGSGARDAAGNRLDGAWTGASSAFLVTFGLVPATAPDMTDCVAATSRIRPDGDDGTGDESDDLEISLQATSAPAWWELIVLDADGALVQLDREAGIGATATVAWSGRDLDGAVVESGDYTVSLTPLDASWNEGIGCTRSVHVEQRIQAPEAAP